MAVEVKLWEIKGTDKALLFSTLPKEYKEGRHVWIPRSQIEHISREAPRVGEWTGCVVTIPDWLADKEEL